MNEETIDHIKCKSPNVVNFYFLNSQEYKLSG